LRRSSLSNDPFQITNHIPYSSYSGSPVHRFFQMWQQLDCDLANATPYVPQNGPAIGDLMDMFNFSQ
jgi:hypothetical protein